MTDSNRCPEDVLSLIPWFHDESLSAADRRRVEDHAEGCAACRDEIELLAGDPVAAARAESDVPDPDALYARVLARIEEDDAGSDGGGATSPPARARSWTNFAMAAGLAALLFGVGVALGNGSLLGGTAPGDVVYRTAAEVPRTSGASAGGSLVDVVFRSEVPVERVARVLREIDAEVVAGPTARGVFRVRVTGDVASAVARLEGAAGAGTTAGIASFAAPAMLGDVDAGQR